MDIEALKRLVFAATYSAGFGPDILIPKGI
jgi:hypothetical protein